MDHADRQDLIPLDTSNPIWSRVFTVAPLVVVGTKELDHYDLAPKHMAMPVGPGNYFAFACTPNHATFHNVQREKEFAVSFPQPSQVLLAGLAAMPRCGANLDQKPIVDDIPTIEAFEVDALLVRDSYLFVECRLERIVGEFDGFSLIIGNIVSAHAHADSLRSSDVDDQELVARSPLLAYLAWGRFARVEESFQFPFPVGMDDRSGDVE